MLCAVLCMRVTRGCLADTAHRDVTYKRMLERWMRFRCLAYMFTMSMHAWLELVDACMTGHVDACGFHACVEHHVNDVLLPSMWD